jgi:hypothetical protein
MFFPALPAAAQAIDYLPEGKVSQNPDANIPALSSSIAYAPTKVSNLRPFAFMGIGLVFGAAGLLFTSVLLFVFPVGLVTLLFCLFGVAFVAFGT